MFHPFEFLKILRNTDGFGRGRGVIQDNPLVVDMAYNYLKFQRVQLLKGGNKKGFLQTTKTVTGQALDILKAQWSQLYSNNENTEKVMILNDGVQFKEISNTAVEMQLAELAKKTDEQIFSLFGTSDGTLSEDTIRTR
jgi:phage portal protein BeeE